MIPAIIAQLEQLIAQVKASGPDADADARLDISTHSKSGHGYACLRNGSQHKSCGRIGVMRVESWPLVLRRLMMSILKLEDA